MNAYEKYLSTLSDSERKILDLYECQWCSQSAAFGYCGSYYEKCSPEKRVEKAKLSMNKSRAELAAKK